MLTSTLTEIQPDQDQIIPATSTEPEPRFDELGLDESLLKALAHLKFERPTPIQASLIPVALAGRDALGQAKTGTGKTAAFALPMLQLTRPGGGLQSMVLVPTRELAKQVAEHVRDLGEFHPLNAAVLYGGQRIERQVAQLKAHPELLIGTPGRIIDMLQRRLISLHGIRLVVLDEVDRMLDIGFRDDIRKILKKLPDEHQTIFVSATIDEEINKLARTFMRDPVEVNVSRDTITVDKIEQEYVSVDPHDKFATLRAFLKHEAPTLAIVFTNTKHAARRVAMRLKDLGVHCKEIHGDLMQTRRDKVMESFRKAHIQVLVATDLVSRGIDVLEVSHIVNYDVPPDPKVYVHRVGRTARMGRNGYALTLVTPEQGKLLTAIEMHINREIPQLDAPWVVKRRPAAAEPAAATPAPPAGAPHEAAEGDGAFQVPSRYVESLRRDALFDSLGFRPLRRTLGSRFRAARRKRGGRPKR